MYLDSIQQPFHRSQQIAVQDILQRIEEKRTKQDAGLRAVIEKCNKEPPVVKYAESQRATRNKGNKWYNRKKLHE